MRTMRTIGAALAVLAGVAAVAVMWPGAALAADEDWLDTSFGIGGTTVIEAGGHVEDSVMDPTGRIYVATTTPSARLWRLTAGRGGRDVRRRIDRPAWADRRDARGWHGRVHRR